MSLVLGQGAKARLQGQSPGTVLRRALSREWGFAKAASSGPGRGEIWVTVCPLGTGQVMETLAAKGSKVCLQFSRQEN